jgi:predicted nucleic acid-binding protein
MLETRSSAFYPYISLEDAIDAIDYATYYKVESWDGYIIRLAKNIGNNIVYTLDEDLKKIKDIIALNPFPKELIEQYHEYIKRKTAEKQRY